MLLSFNSVAAQEMQGGEFSKQGALYFTNDGVIVNTLVYDVIKANENITLYMTPYQLNGKTYDNSSVDCRVGIVNPDGTRLYLLEQANFTVIGNNDIWTATLPGSFLYETGEYLFNWDCQDGTRGGYFNSHMAVTINGELAGDTMQIFIWVVFITATIGNILLLILILVKLATTRETVFGVLMAWGFYILMIVSSYLGGFLISSYITDLADIFLTIFVWSNGVLPVISLIITMFVKGTKKKSPISIEEMTGRVPFFRGGYY